MMRSRIQRWRQAGFLPQVLTLVSGTLLAQVFTLLILPILGTQYGSEAFGIQGIFIALVNTIVIAVNGGYEVAIMLPKQMRVAKMLLYLSCVLAIVISTVLWGIMTVLGPWAWKTLNSPELASWQWLLVLSILLEGLNQPIRVFLNRLKAYKALSISRMVQAFVAGTVMLSLGWLEAGFEGLLIGFVSGQAGCFLVLLIRYFGWKDQINFPWSFRAISAVAREYIDFPQKSVWATWLNSFSRQLPFFLLPAFFNQEVAGWFRMAHMALMTPFALLSRSVGEVFYEKAARALETGKQALSDLTQQTASYLAIMGLLPMILVMIAAPTAVVWFFDESWYQTGIYARWLMPWVYLMFIASPLSYLIDIRRKLGFLFRYNLALFLVRLSALVLGGYVYKYIFQDTGTIILYSLFGGALVAFHIGFLLRIGYVWGKK